jgi:hypothetical protein
MLSKAMVTGGWAIVTLSLGTLASGFPTTVRTHWHWLVVATVVGVVVAIWGHFLKRSDHDPSVKQETHGDDSPAVLATQGGIGVGGDVSGDLIKDSVVHKGDNHYYGQTTKELNRRFKELEAKISHAGGSLVNGFGVGDEPLIYLDIQPATDGIRDRIVCDNRGPNVAHNVQVNPVTLADVTLEFASIGAIGPNKEQITTPVADGQGLMVRSSIFYWLLQDWDREGNAAGEWPVRMSVTYTNALGDREFTGTMVLIFYPIKYQMMEKLGQRTEKTWEFKNIQFSAEPT